MDNQTLVLHGTGGQPIWVMTNTNIYANWTFLPSDPKSNTLETSDFLHGFWSFTNLESKYQFVGATNNLPTRALKSPYKLTQNMNDCRTIICGAAASAHVTTETHLCCSFTCVTLQPLLWSEPRCRKGEEKRTSTCPERNLRSFTHMVKYTVGYKVFFYLFLTAFDICSNTDKQPKFGAFGGIYDTVKKRFLNKQTSYCTFNQAGSKSPTQI